MNELIRITDLHKIYDSGAVQVHALQDINLTIEQGEFVAIMGHSGSGKSTLMNILGCLDRPTSGQYLLDGIDVSQQSNDALSDIRNQKIGFVFQAFNLIPRTSALNNVELPMIYARVPAKTRLQRATALLEKVGLGQRLDHMPNQLSGGQKQRVAIARALANEPPILLADEPTGNLDSASTVEIMELFTQLNREGVTVLIVTHEDDVAAFTDRVLWFEDGRLLHDRKVEKQP
ncbi:MAG: ABC transporter ATP-binding protein [Peptococcaceae bacterium]